jgi:hypothetical protein
MAMRRYQITVEGRIGPEVTAEFAQFRVVCENGRTMIAGRTLDQAALHAVLHRLDALGLVLLGVTSSEP